MVLIFNENPPTFCFPKERIQFYACELSFLLSTVLPGGNL